MIEHVRPGSSEPPRSERPARPPLRLFTTLLHLGAYALFGFGVLGGLLGLIGAGLGLTLVLGLGLILLVASVYALFGLAWFETARVSGLYRLPLPPLRFTPAQPGFSGWLRSLLRQVAEPRMWRAVASFAIASCLGIALAAVIRGAAWASAHLVSGSSEPLLLPVSGAMLSPGQLRLVGGLGLLVAAAAAIGLALLHRTLTIALLGSAAREAELRDRAQRSGEQRAGALRAAEVERTRIERDLHDGVQPRLVSVGMTLGLAQQTIDRDPEAARALIAEAHTSTKAAITELRQLARGIHASVLDDRGLDAALSALAGRSHIPVILDVRVPERVDRDAESAVYFCVAEALTNAAKHSRASESRVTVRLRDEPTGQVLWARIEDNGIGGASVQPGGGLDGISNRVLAAGGTIRIDSPLGGPSAVEVSVPCAS